VNQKLLVIATAVVAALVQPAGAQIAFAPQVTYAPGSQPETTALADFNSDGDFDAAVTSDAPDKVTIHANNGSGVLALAQTVLLPNASSPHFVVAADLDADGDLDLGVTLKNANAVTVIFNTGSTFAASGVLMPTGLQPRSLVAADLNGDTFPDLVASNRDSNTLSIFRNVGNGTFLAPVSVVVGQDPRHVVAADVDGDGDRDVVVANNDSNNLSILFNDGLGNLTAGVPLGAGIFDPEGVAAVDLDGDHDLDIVATGHDNTTAQNVVLVYLNAGAGAFAGPTAYPIGGQGPGFVAAADFDLDGDADVATANQDSNDVSVLPNTGAGVLGAAVLVAVGAGPEHVVARDVDGDQLADLVATNDGGTTISVLLNQASNGTLALLGPTTIGTAIPLQVSSPLDPGDFYVCGLSFGTAPGVTMEDGRHVPINLDLLLTISLIPNNGFVFNNWGFLTPGGSALVSIAVPPVPALVGASIHATCVILNPYCQDNLEQSFGPLQITFQ
jgi:hypothetical protein